MLLQIYYHSFIHCRLIDIYIVFLDISYNSANECACINENTHTHTHVDLC